MMYLRWKLSDGGTHGAGPEANIAARGGRATASWAVDADGYRVGYLTEISDISNLDAWNVTELSEADALTFCQQFYAAAAVLPDGTISGPPPPE